MRSRYIFPGIVGIALGVLLTAAVVALAGNPAGPGTPPANTFSFTLEDIYNRLATVQMVRQARGRSRAWRRVLGPATRWMR